MHIMGSALAAHTHFPGDSIDIIHTAARLQLGRRDKEVLLHATREMQPHPLEGLQQTVDDFSRHSTGLALLLDEGVWKGSPRVHSKLLCGAGLDPQKHLEPSL